MGDEGITNDSEGREGGQEVAPGVCVRPDALEFSFVSSSGPGGQNVNKRATKAQLRVAVDALGLEGRVASRLRDLAGAQLTNEDEILIASDRERTQRRNREACLERLRELLVEAAAVPKKRRPTRPTRGSIERRIEEKKQRGETKRRRRPPRDP